MRKIIKYNPEDILKTPHNKQLAIEYWKNKTTYAADEGDRCGGDYCEQNDIPSFVATRYGRWDYPAAYSLIGTIAMCGGAFGLIMTGILPTTKSSTPLI